MWEYRVFTRKIGKRMFIVLGLTALVYLWFTVFVGFFAGQGWLWKALFGPKDAQTKTSVFLVTVIAVDIAAILSHFVYLNAVKWMLPFLKNAFFSIFCWVPFIHRLDPLYRNSMEYKKRRMKKLKKQLKKLNKDSQEWKAASNELGYLAAEMRAKEFDDMLMESMTPVDEDVAAYNAKRNSTAIALERLMDTEDGYYHDDAYYYGENPNKGFFSKVFAFILGIVLEILKGVAYLLGAVAIPVFSPVVIVLGVALIEPLLQTHKTLILALGWVLLVLAVVILVVYPVLCLQICKKYEQMPETFDEKTL